MEPKHCLIGRKETSLIHVRVCELSLNGNAYWLEVIKVDNLRNDQKLYIY